MAKSNSTRRSTRPKGRSSPPISYQPGKGLVVSTQARFPVSVDEKIVCAKSIIQAVVAAHDGAQDMGNYDIHWPLSLAVEILEQVADQLGKREVYDAMGNIEGVDEEAGRSDGGWL